MNPALEFYRATKYEREYANMSKTEQKDAKSVQK